MIENLIYVGSQPEYDAAIEETVVHWTVYGMLEGDLSMEAAHASAVQFVQEGNDMSIVCPLTPELAEAIQKEVQLFYQRFN